MGEIPPVQAFLITEASTGNIIAEQNKDQMLKSAGLTKLMSWLLILETVDLNSEITVSAEAASMSGTRVFLDAGAKYTADVLLKASIMCSANDATVALAEAAFGSESATVAAMNERATNMGIDAKFVDSTGQSDDNIMSAQAIATVASELAKHSEFFKYSKLYLETFTHESGRTTEMVNPNKLVRNDDVDGMATGSSTAAGYGAAISSKSGSSRFICVVLGATNSEARFTAATAGINYAQSAFSSKNIANAGEKVTTLEVPGSNEGDVDALATENLDVLIKKGEKVDTQIILDEQPALPIIEGQIIGKIVATLPDGSTREVTLAAAHDVAEKSYSYCLKRVLEDWLHIN